MDFLEKLKKKITENNSLLCIGLDTDVEKIPAQLKNGAEPAFAFNKAIIDATVDLVCCFKANIAFYASQGPSGTESLINTIKYVHEQYPETPVILDAKRADTGNTSEQYAKEVFDVIGADAVTVNPYLGFDAIEPFLKRKEKGVIVLCKTSNPGAMDFQDLNIGGEPLYVRVAQKVATWHQTYGNCLLVFGATWPEELRKVRDYAPNMFFLVPGIGPQGGDLQKTLENGLSSDKSGLIIHSARAIIYASSEKDFAQRAYEQAVKLKNSINKYKMR